jgi:hypothetical protein
MFVKLIAMVLQKTASEGVSTPTSNRTLPDWTMFISDLLPA